MKAFAQYLSLAAAFMLLAAAPARATIVYSTQNVTEVSPSTGDTFEVDVTNTGAAVVIDSFGFGLSLPTGFIITNATDDTLVNPYIFAGNSLDDDTLFPLYTNSLPDV